MFYLALMSASPSLSFGFTVGTVNLCVVIWLICHHYKLQYRSTQNGHVLHVLEWLTVSIATVLSNISRPSSLCSPPHLTLGRGRLSLSDGHQTQYSTAY